MPKNQFQAIEVLEWSQVRQRVNPKLAKIIDEFHPSKQHSFVKIRYPYGVDIKRKGKFLLPTENYTLKPFNEYPTPSIKKLLNYNAAPIAVILDKYIEVYIQSPDGRTVPYKIFGPGVTFGVWEIMEMPKIILRQGWSWSISAGAKTIFLLPKISDTAGHNRLKQKYGIKSYLPDSIFGHHEIFTELAQANREEHPWFVELLVFSAKWFEPQEKNIGWVKLQLYWAQEAWHQMLHWSNKVYFDLSWETFLLELNQRKIKMDTYLLDTLKHLISIAFGIIPGFKIAGDESAAPTKLIEQCYINDYGLKIYAPVIMQPAFLQINHRDDAVYYSLQIPTLPQKLPIIKNFTSTMRLIRELKNLLEIFLETANKWPEPLAKTGRYDFLKHITFDYFHSDFDKLKSIMPIDAMLKADPTLRKHEKLYPDRLFPENGSFLKGCIKVSFHAVA